MLTCQVTGNGVKILFTSFWEDSKASQDTLNDPQQTRPSYGNMRPLYLKIQNDVHYAGYGNSYQQEHGFPKLNSSYNTSHTSRQNYLEALNQTWPVSQRKLSSRKLAILEPLDNQYQYGLFKVYNEDLVQSPHPHVSINPSNLPPLDWRQQSRWVQEEQKIQDSQKTNRWSKRPEDSHRRQIIGDRENGLRPVLARQTKYPSTQQTNGHAAVLPSTPSQPERFVSPVPSPQEMQEPLPQPMREPSPQPLREPSPLAPLAPPSPLPQTQDGDLTLPLVPSSNSLQVEDLSGDNISEEPRSRPSSQAKEEELKIIQVDTLNVEEERLSTPPPAPLPPPPLETEPDTTLSEELIVEEKMPLNRKKFGKNIGKPRLRVSRGSTKEMNGISPSSSPDVAPFDNPKEALSRCLQQLEHPEWEVTVQGLKSLVRLTLHHPSLLLHILHQVVVAVTKHVRNLRSQVARAACKSAMHLFSSIGRAIENVRDMEELCAVLLNRTADTNKFLRADCNSALDAMVDNVSSTKIVASIVNKGAKHQNAIVRATACRLLLRLCERLGPERVLSLPRETRDAILNTGARCLTEGSLDTRRYAKEMFILLSQDTRLLNLLTEVVPTSVMRSISKVLARLTVK